MEIHLTTTECHLPYGIAQCYLPPDTSEHTPPLPQPDRLVLENLENLEILETQGNRNIPHLIISQTGQYSIYVPWMDERLS